jgi:hypothetical protein
VSRVQHRSRGSARTLIWTGVALLAACILTLASNAVFIRASTPMANAIEAAKGRDSSNLLARDLLVTMDDDSAGIWQRYRTAIEFLDTVRPEELDPADILDRPNDRRYKIPHLCLGDLLPEAGFFRYIVRYFCRGKEGKDVAGFKAEMLRCVIARQEKPI